jgi:CheY-like chemotaxis protein
MLLTSSKGFHHDQESSYLILSVDDDPINQLVIENLLLPEGCFVLQQAMGGHEALEFLATHPVLPDLILLDIMMPDMSGYEVCEEVRRTYNETVPIMMVSAKDSPDDIARGLGLGANDYVKKPFHRQEVREILLAVPNLTDS